MKRTKFIPGSLAAFFTILTIATGLTACSSDDGGGTPPDPSILEQYFFRVKNARHINDFFPEQNSDKAITSIGPENVDIKSGEAQTFSIAVNKNIKIDKFYIGAENIPSTNKVAGYYEVTAKKGKEPLANLYGYNVTLNFPENAKANFLIKIAGVTINNDGSREITKISKIPVHLTPLVPENIIIGKWSNLQKNGATTPENDNVLIAFEKNNSGYTQNFLEDRTTAFTYNYSPADNHLFLILNDEIIDCTIKFSTDQDTIFITENYRFKNEEVIKPADVKTEYTLTRIYE